jgi:hypothetical protein
MKMKRQHGFLFLYDWYPLLKALSPQGAQELMLALMDRQRNGTPMPHFTDPMSEVFFQTIEPTIERRLGEQQENPKDSDEEDLSVGGTVATEASKAKQSKAKKSKAISIAKKEGEENHESDTFDASDSPPPLLSKKEKEKLLSLGVPNVYIEDRISRAQQYGDARGKTVARVILDWWEQDCALPDVLQHGDVPQIEPPPFDCNSFDTDDFFQAALKKSFSEA